MQPSSCSRGEEIVMEEGEGKDWFLKGVGIRGEIIVPARRLELKHDATEVELTSTVRFL